ncbi:MAG: L-lysine 6-transaminase [Planctomycetes bacterium]|nr:L-lysine 6-transaminase [Planctomycetota bacterium]
MSNPTTKSAGYQLPANEVHDVLSRHILADGMPIVFDWEQSKGSWLFDARSGERYLDLFSFFASQPLGYNHPRMTEPEFLGRLLRAAMCKPTNSDIYSSAMASFVKTFAETAIPEAFRKHLFFVEGGALAVENALKCAFDWKYRRNLAKGGPDTENLEILHFKWAFHGRSGYTMSLTNTADPRKYQFFPRFCWPRVEHPSIHFPQDAASTARVEAAEANTLAAMRQAFENSKDRIAAVIIETIQGEGGDNHARPEFFAALRELCDERDALLIFDEVQTGMGLTGTWWAFEQLGTVPDIFCFGKKSQVCGIAAGPRIDEVEKNVFRESSRINSTWGGSLVDMVRCEQYVRIIDEDNLLDNARSVGAHVRQSLLEVAQETGKIDNVRGQGLMIAFDFADGAARSAAQKALFASKVIMLPCGARSLRFRSVLDMTRADADLAVAAIRSVL